MSSADESSALMLLRERIQKEKLNCYDYLCELNQADATSLEHCGYRGKTNAEAMREAFQSYTKGIEKLIAKHEKDFPDA